MNHTFFAEDFPKQLLGNTIFYKINGFLSETMPMKNLYKKWIYFRYFILKSYFGFPEMFFKHPLFSLKLLKARLMLPFYNLSLPMETPHCFVIESIEEFATYWGLFIADQCATMRWKKKLASERNPVVLDVGANAGLFCKLVWNLNPQVELIAFEPLPKMAAKIKQWRDATGARLTLHEKAADDNCGFATIYASKENDPEASLLPRETDGFRFEIPTVTLDSIVPKQPIFLMKIDVEGFECKVLTGAKEILSRTKFLVVEAHTAEALKKIKQLIPIGWNCEQVGASDFLFMQKNSSKN